MRLLTTNYCTETATVVTASTSNPSFPSSNLKHPFRSKRWRSTGVASENVVFDFQTSEAVDSVVLLWSKEDGIRLSDSAVIRVQANATDDWSSPSVNQIVTIDDTYEVASHFFSSDQSYRYWRILITDAGNPFGYLELGVVWIGKSLALENAQNGFKYDLVDRSKSSSTDYGHTYTDELPLVATLNFQYSYLDYEAVQILENAFRTNGSKKPVLVVLDPTEAVFSKDHFLVYGKFKNSLDLIMSIMICLIPTL
jgi:hypothetical protein